MTVRIRNERENWDASVTDGIWESESEGVSAVLQAICRDVGYVPDDEYTLAVIVRDQWAGVEIVTPQPRVQAGDPEIVY